MNTIVKTIDSSQQEAIKQQFSAYQIANNNPYVTFAAKIKGTTLLSYTSGKLVLQGQTASQLAKEMGFKEQEDNHSTQPVGQEMALIGSDEVGNGSYFGGLAVVASFVEPQQHAFLRKLGVDDSKNLNDTKICQLAPILEEKIVHQSLLLSPKKYNQVVGDSNPYNAVSVKVALHNQAIFLLLQKGIKPQKIVIDAFTSPKNYQKYEKQEKNHFDNPLTLEEKAEGKYLAVAVSSIIARALFLKNLEQLSQEIGYKLPSGAGKPSDQVASHILNEYGMEGLEKTAKLHFANTKKAQALATHYQ